MLAIENDEKLKKVFLDSSDFADVVLACRVSPKQKAEIVMLIRSRFPEKVTLSIGDGANDVSMILKAHVGVGILGKEGQQAARSADFSIGQFKFLKPLLFIHGREAYRRNSTLIGYTFYKNVMYVMAQYYFGFNSGFSGQTLYDPFIYQMYNITMTSLPIMWFALYDLEHVKETFMRNPMLYRIGIENACFSMSIYTMWVAYALFHGCIVWVFCILAICPEVRADGKDLGFWVAGHLVYGCCCFIANAIILTRTNNFTGYGEGLNALMIFAYFFFMGVQSALGSVTLAFPDLSHIFENMFTVWNIWFAILLTVGAVVNGEMWFRAWIKLIPSDSKYGYSELQEDT